ncbi:DUF6612 family protein [Paenibacillus sp. CAU 1782]
MSSFCKTTLAVSLLLLFVLSGCEQQSIKKVEIHTNDQGLPEAEELLRLSSELVNSLESYGVDTEGFLRNYGSTKEELIWEGPTSATALQYVKSPYLLFSEIRFQKDNSIINYYVADAYGVFEKRIGEPWIEISNGDQRAMDIHKEQWQPEIDPFAVIKGLKDLTLTIGQENDRFILNVTGINHEQTSQEGHHDMNGKEYTLVINKDQKYKLRYVIHKDTLLPLQKIEEVEQMMDYSGEKLYSDRTITFTYEDFNKINSNGLINEAKKISEAVKEN